MLKRHGNGKRYGKCTNFDECPVATAHKVIGVNEGEDFVCLSPPDGCGLPLLNCDPPQIVPDIKWKKIILFVLAAILLLGVLFEWIIPLIANKNDRSIGDGKIIHNTKPIAAKQEIMQSASGINWVKVNAMVENISGYTFNGVSYNMFSVKIDSSTIRKFDIISNSGELNHRDFIANINLKSLFLINACVSGVDGTPIGYYTRNSIQIQDVNLRSGTGNFYLQPNGALLFTASDAIICKTAQIKNQLNVELGVQSGPMLVIDGAIHPAFTQESPNINLRAGVGIFSEKGQKYLIFCISNKGVNFYNFAKLFQSLHCTNALSLDNDGVAMYFPDETDGNNGVNSIIHNYILYKY
jgi:uncharacterized protein YigE (DUF2233 family)